MEKENKVDAVEEPALVKCGYLICTVMLQYAGQGPAVLSYIDGKVEVLCLWVRENGNVCVCGGGGVYTVQEI